MEQTINTASRQWATRPDDQRFLTLEELKSAVQRRKQQSWTSAIPVNSLRVIPDEEENNVLVQAFDTTARQEKILEMSNWSFSQLSQTANAPASYLRKLPAVLAAINLQYGLEKIPAREDGLILGQTNGENVLRAITSTSYGRIWDLEVVEAVERVNINGTWQVPASSYSHKDPRRATTLYASDRDVFIFLVDPHHPVTVGNETLFRGFMVWNSETGSATFGLTTFLYRFVCDNRIVWGATNIRELRIKHTGGAPERFAYEGRKYLQAYSEEATYQIVETVKKAQTTEIKDPENPDKGWAQWLQKRGFTSTHAKESVKRAIEEEGGARSLWDIVNGVTAYARGIKHTDERVKLETQAGNLLKSLE